MNTLDSKFHYKVTIGSWKKYDISRRVGKIVLG